MQFNEAMIIVSVYKNMLNFLIRNCLLILKYINIQNFYLS